MSTTAPRPLESARRVSWSNCNSASRPTSRVLERIGTIIVNQSAGEWLAEFWLTEQSPFANGQAALALVQKDGQAALALPHTGISSQSRGFAENRAASSSAPNRSASVFARSEY